jgi:hypothetical protein
VEFRNDKNLMSGAMDFSLDGYRDLQLDFYQMMTDVYDLCDEVDYVFSGRGYLTDVPVFSQEGCRNMLFRIVNIDKGLISELRIFGERVEKLVKTKGDMFLSSANLQIQKDIHKFTIVNIVLVFFSILVAFLSIFFSDVISSRVSHYWNNGEYSVDSNKLMEYEEFFTEEDMSSLVTEDDATIVE